MSDLTLGSSPGKLELIYVPGDPWSVSLTLRQKDTGIAIPWPSAPVLEFPDLTALNQAATLGPSSDVVPVADAKATWNLLEATVTDIHAAAVGEATTVRLAVGGVTWWKGFTKPDA